MYILMHMIPKAPHNSSQLDESKKRPSTGFTARAGDDTRSFSACWRKRRRTNDTALERSPTSLLGIFLLGHNSSSPQPNDRKVTFGSESDFLLQKGLFALKVTFGVKSHFLLQSDFVLQKSLFARKVTFGAKSHI